MRTLGERLKIAQSKTLVKVRNGDLATFSERLKTLKEGLSYFFDSLVLAHCHVVMRS